MWQAESDKTSKFQTHLSRNSGISFVRGGREIDFGNFGYFVSYDLTDRYWGCEILFSPTLDSILVFQTINKELEMLVLSQKL